MLRKALLIVASLVALNALGRAFATSAGVVVGLVLGWLAFSYLVWRAWPAMRRDIERLAGGLVGRGVRLPAGRSVRLRRRASEDGF